MKKKMSNAKFTRIWSAIAAVILILCVVLNVAADMFSAVLESYLGRGEMVVQMAEGTENWNTTYYEKSTDSMEEAKAASNIVSEKMTDEAIVLLKNKDVLPLEKGSEVTPFGFAYLEPAYSGSGAAATKDEEMVTVDQALASYFTVNNAAVDKMNGKEARFSDAATGALPLDYYTGSLFAKMDKGESAKIYGYDPSIYSGIENDVKDSTGIVFIKRTGSEGIDKHYDSYEDGTPHYLALSADEKETIKYAKETCGKVILVLNTSNPMELGPVMSGEYEADAILLVGMAGSRGFQSMAKIMAGEVNPSGHLADIYPTDFKKDPTYANFGVNQYSNSTVTDTSYIPQANMGTIQRPYVEYEEGIYVGYRYYETAAIMDEEFVYGTLDEKGAALEEGAVAYPFGYGLSYTTFEQKITDFSVEEENIKVSVEVTNTGNVSGKDVVQIYYTAPYTEYDAENGIEKAATVLKDFNKTETLEPGASQTVEFTFAKEDMASYDASHSNDDGTTGCYFLEAGEYQIELKADSHTVLDSRTVEVEEDVFYQGENVRQSEIDAQSKLDEDGNIVESETNNQGFIAATNQFENMNTYMSDENVTNLSRSDWKGTQPTAPENHEGVAPQVALDEFAAYDVGEFDIENDELYGNTNGSLVTEAAEAKDTVSNGMSLIDMRGKEYNDESWNTLLDQVDWNGEKEDIQKLLYNAAYQTKALESVGKPATTDKDGAMGWSVEGASSWTSANMMACTWNKELMYEYGLSIGEEALQAGLTGWYAPGVNMHRSQFGGRVYEYFSEDGVLSGKLAAATISGAGDKGLICYLKHMVLNEQEIYRATSIATWVGEQALREIYLKPFEICVKEAKSTINYITDNQGTHGTKVIRSALGIMSAQSCIGGTIGFAHYGLLTGVLRNEWGFQGAVVTDLFPSSATNLRDHVIRVGGDLFMCTDGRFAEDYDSSVARNAMRNALHNILYATVNSNAMNGIASDTYYYYKNAWWQNLLIAIRVVVPVLILAILGRIILRRKDEKKNPEKYLKKGEKRVKE